MAELHDQCLATKQVFSTKNIGFCYREQALFPTDSGWRFYTSRETDAELADPQNSEVYSLAQLVELVPVVASLLDEPEGSAFQISAAGEIAPVAASVVSQAMVTQVKTLLAEFKVTSAADFAELTPDQAAALEMQLADWQEAQGVDDDTLEEILEQLL